MNRTLFATALLAGTSILTGCGGMAPTSPATSSLLAPTSTGTSGSSSTPAAAPASAPTAPATTTPATSTGTTTTTPTTTSSTGTTTTAPPTTSTATTATTSSALPTPPSSATVFNDIDDSTDSWSSCSTCAGGAVTSAFWSAPFQTTPSVAGSSRQFYIAGPAWASALWIKKFGAQNASTHFLWDFWVYFDATSAANSWSAEYDLWQAVGKQEFMIGSQCVFGTNEWDMWDSANNKWVNSGVPCPRFSAEKWHHIQWYVERTSATTYRYNTLVVDEQPFTLNRTFSTNPTDWDDSLGVQWQLDQNGTGLALSQWVDNAKLTIW